MIPFIRKTLRFFFRYIFKFFLKHQFTQSKLNVYFKHILYHNFIGGSICTKNKKNKNKIKQKKSLHSITKYKRYYKQNGTFLFRYIFKFFYTKFLHYNSIIFTSKIHTYLSGDWNDQVKTQLAISKYKCALLQAKRYVRYI